MRAGKLRHRVQLQALADGPLDDYSQPTQTWQDFGVPEPADIRYLKGLEAVKSGAPLAIAAGSMRIRFRAGVVANMRGVDEEDGTVYDIKAVLPDQTGRKHLDLVFQTGENQG